MDGITDKTILLGFCCLLVFKKAYIAALPLLLAFFEPARREPGQGNLGACCSTCYNPSL